MAQTAHVCDGCYHVMFALQVHALSRSELPLNDRDSYSWVVDQAILPRNQLESVSLATIRASSPLSLTYSLHPLDSSSGAFADIGLGIKGQQVVLSHLLLQNLNTVSFPLRGLVRISDTRSYCLETITDGPCVVSIPFSLNVGQFNPACPRDVLVFAPSTAHVSWSEPKLAMRDLTRLSLQGSATPGSAFSRGSTQVTYALQHDPSQLGPTRIGCFFNVCAVVH
jgi:hypothetical protein